MSPYVLAAGALAGYFVVEKTDLLKGVQVAPHPAVDASQQQANNMWPSWLNIGSQPSTGQGQNPTETVNAVANAVAGVGNAVSSLAKYFGTSEADDNGASAGYNGSGGAGWALPDFGPSGSGAGITEWDDK